jgi:hypothetical protein
MRSCIWGGRGRRGWGSGAVVSWGLAGIVRNISVTKAVYVFDIEN